MIEKTEEIEVKTGVETRPAKAEKREVISISVSAEEKRRISVEALKDYGTSVSDLIRSRMFVKPEELETTEKEFTLEDEDIQIHKEVIRQLRAELATTVQDLRFEITNLKDENTSLKTKLNTPDSENSNSENEDKQQNENILLLEFATSDLDNESIIQKIKKFRSELLEKTKNLDGFQDFESFAKLMFMRGLKRTYNNGILNESTGLRISEVEHFSKLENFNYGEEV